MVQREERDGLARAGGTRADDPARWLGRATRMLERGCGLCRELESLSERQSELVRGGDADGLLRVLGERQQIVDQLTELTSALEPLRLKWDSGVEGVSQADRAALENRAAELTESLARIGRRDEADRAALESQRGRVAEEIGSVSRGRGAVAAYGGGAPLPGARFQDRRG